MGLHVQIGSLQAGQSRIIGAALAVHSCWSQAPCSHPCAALAQPLPSALGLVHSRPLATSGRLLVPPLLAVICCMGACARQHAPRPAGLQRWRRCSGRRLAAVERGHPVRQPRGAAARAASPPAGAACASGGAAGEEECVGAVQARSARQPVCCCHACARSASRPGPPGSGHPMGRPAAQHCAWRRRAAAPQGNAAPARSRSRRAHLPASKPALMPWMCCDSRPAARRRSWWRMLSSSTVMRSWPAAGEGSARRQWKACACSRGGEGAQGRQQRHAHMGQEQG